MKRLSTAVSFLLMLVAVPAMAQKPTAKQPGPKGSISPGELTPTPEMWFYEQFQLQYQDPKAMVRKNAEFRAAQRQRRIAARKWFGFSNVRPRAGTDPLHGDWSPGWTSNNANYPFRWSGFGRPSVVVRPYGPRLWHY